jgi:glycosyltransferase 2 family protein
LTDLGHRFLNPPDRPGAVRDNGWLRAARQDGASPRETVIGLALAASVVQGRRGRGLEPAESMKRLMDFAWPTIGLGAVAFSLWLLWKELRGVSVADVVAGFAAIPRRHWYCAALSTVAAYAALAWYDRIGLAHLGRRLSWGFISLTSFTTYALSHNIGASVFSGAVVRYRAYSTKGLSVAEVGLLVAFCSFTFFLGTVLLGGLVLTFEPGIAERWVAAPNWLARLIGLVMLAGVGAYMTGSLFHFRPLKIGRFELVYPRPPIAARQFLAAPLELLGAAGIIYFTLPTAGNPGYFVVLGVFLASFSIALASHAPGGFGVLEFAFVKAMPDAPKAEVLAALIAFRLLYLIVPLLFALVVVVLFERRRIVEVLRARL